MISLIVTSVSMIDKLENIPGVDDVLGITQVGNVPCIVTNFFIPANALVPTVKPKGVLVYPRLIVAKFEQF